MACASVGWPVLGFDLRPGGCTEDVIGDDHGLAACLYVQRLLGWSWIQEEETPWG